MSRKSIRMVIVLATIIFIGLVSTQIIWVKNAYEISESQIHRELEQALIQVAKNMQRHSGDSVFLVDPVRLVAPNVYRVQVNEEPTPFYLETMLSQELLSRELNFDFQFSIYNCFNDSVVYTKTITNDADAGATLSEQPTLTFEDDGHYFAVFFPTLHTEVLSEMRFWVASSLVLLGVLVFFTYVINIILRQKRLSEVKTDFINNMTHELKTPISTISLSAEVLLGQKELAAERVRTYAEIIRNENRRLQTQVERVLQVARLEKESTHLDLKTVDMHDLIANALPTIQLNFGDKQIQLTTNLKAENYKIDGDELHLTNVVFNLLDNAAKYGGNEPRIEVSTHSTSRYFHLTVADGGPGIAREHQKLIFEKFYRVSTGDVHDVKGFGLGLHYVKTITEAHRGKVTLKSSPGHGSIFTVVLPLKQV